MREKMARLLQSVVVVIGTIVRGQEINDALFEGAEVRFTMSQVQSTAASCQIAIRERMKRRIPSIEFASISNAYCWAFYPSAGIFTRPQQPAPQIATCRHQAALGMPATGTPHPK